MQSGEARVLTSDLTSIIRQQRHTGTRVFIATQEPTLAPELIDLSNVTFVHRFLSPSWYQILKKHLAGANKHESGDSNKLFETIVKLRTGQALMFSPTALTELPASYGQPVQLLGNGYLKVSIRKRLTADGGRSMASSESATLSSGQTVDVQVPMHVVVRPPQPLNTKRGQEGPKRRLSRCKEIQNRTRRSCWTCWTCSACRTCRTQRRACRPCRHCPSCASPRLP